MSDYQYLMYLLDKNPDARLPLLDIISALEDGGYSQERLNKIKYKPHPNGGYVLRDNDYTRIADIINRLEGF